jgi:hypothetical protein
MILIKLSKLSVFYFVVKKTIVQVFVFYTILVVKVKVKLKRQLESECALNPCVVGLSCKEKKTRETKGKTVVDIYRALDRFLSLWDLVFT